MHEWLYYFEIINSNLGNLKVDTVTSYSGWSSAHKGLLFLAINARLYGTVTYKIGDTQYTQNLSTNGLFIFQHEYAANQQFLIVSATSDVWYGIKAFIVYS